MDHSEEFYKEHIILMNPEREDVLIDGKDWCYDYAEKKMDMESAKRMQDYYTTQSMINEYMRGK